MGDCSPRAISDYSDYRRPSRARERSYIYIEIFNIVMVHFVIMHLLYPPCTLFELRVRTLQVLGISGPIRSIQYVPLLLSRSAVSSADLLPPVTAFHCASEITMNATCAGVNR